MQKSHYYELPYPDLVRAINAEIAAGWDVELISVLTADAVLVVYRRKQA